MIAVLLAACASEPMEPSPTLRAAVAASLPAGEPELSDRVLDSPVEQLPALRVRFGERGDEASLRLLAAALLLSAREGEAARLLAPACSSPHARAELLGLCGTALLQVGRPDEARVALEAALHAPGGPARSARISLTELWR